MTENPYTDLDAVVIGSGFGGIYMLKKLCDELGPRTQAFDRAGGVGGTWFWNRYPGAKSDTETFVIQLNTGVDSLAHLGREFHPRQMTTGREAPWRVPRWTPRVDATRRATRGHCSPCCSSSSPRR